MKNKATKTCLFLALAAILITTSTANMSTASSGSDLKISNLLGATTSLTPANLLSMPKTTVNAGLYCYGLLVASGDWNGVKLSDLLNQAGLDPAVASISFTASDGYTVALPINIATRPDVIIAYDLDGAPLSEGLRLVVPDVNGNIWIAQITSINMSLVVVTQSIGEAGLPVNAPALNSDSNTSVQQIIQQQQLPTPTPASTIKPSTQPAPTPTNATAPAQQNSNPQNNSLPVEVGYGVALFAFVVVLAVGLLIYRVRRLVVQR
jgi:hypothetical protein